MLAPGAGRAPRGREAVPLHTTPALAAAITGNSRLLATLTGGGELQAFYWPHIDREQQVERFLLGLSPGARETLWLHEAPWRHRQWYETDTAILQTEATHPAAGFTARWADFAVPGRDSLIRHVRIQNVSGAELPVRLLVYAHLRLDDSDRQNTVLAFPEGNGLLFYRRETHLALGADQVPAGFQAGRSGRPSDARPQAGAGQLLGRAIDCGDVNGALAFDLGMLGPGDRTAVTLYLAAGTSRQAVAAEVAALQAKPADVWQAETAAWWHEWLARGHKKAPGLQQAATGASRLDELYRRSLITLKLLADERGGGLIAGPECDPDYKLSGGYAYTWGRDAAYMTTALDEAGLHAESSDFFLRWAVRAQGPDGMWLHRHYVDGTLAPSWGLLQIDEGGSILYGAGRHYELTGDREFAAAFWPAARSGAEFLLAYRDEETGLPDHSIDLWEKRDGIHAYSSAAVWAGLMAAARLADAVGERDHAIRYSGAAAGIREAILRHLWSADKGRFLRTIKLVGTGPAEAGRQDLAQGDLPDISLLGPFFPFGLLPADDPQVAATAAVLERELAAVLEDGRLGPVYRYPGDQYIGGHPWLICSLWLAIWKVATGDGEQARQLIDWTAGQATETGLLPEQVDLTTGEPTWVTPLAWSHAMFVLALHRL